MLAGLVLVHVHSRLVAVDNSSPSAEEALLEYVDHKIHPHYPLWQFYINKFVTVNFDYGAALLLAILLAVKYVLFDAAVDSEVEKLLKAEPLKEGHKLIYPDKATQPPYKMPSQIRETCNGCHPLDEHAVISKKADFQAASFFLGGQEPEDSSSSEEEKDDRKNKKHIHTQTENDAESKNEKSVLNGAQSMNGTSNHTSEEKPRTIEECVAILNSDAGPEALTDEEIKLLVKSRHIPPYKLESMLGDHIRGVSIRRQLLTGQLTSQSALDCLPFRHYDYKYVEGACCENVIGYMPVPVGVAGPLLLNGIRYQVPMATTEGCLVASTNRGCRAIEQSGGATSCVTNDGMTRGPVVRFPKAARASEVKQWLEKPDNFDLVKDCFDTTSRFARLKSIKISQAGRSLYIRFVSTTGDAMGMNMLSKGSEKSLNMLSETFPDMEIISLSGNFCTDKKPAAINWIEGRGKSVVSEAIIKSNIVKNTLKTTVPALLELNISKNLVGSAMAGSIGGFNAHAANIVTAIYIAAGQDPAQNISSSNCIVLMEASGPNNDDLHITCTMPSIEVGTIGGGTVLPPQSACLQMLGVKGSCLERPGDHARCLAQIVCATVMAGELSLMSALAAGHLVKSHLKHNRSTVNMAPASPMEENGKALPHAASAPGMCTNKAS